jgi:peptidyl-prolyl cis-trans isomerase A (cyclophilin A)
MKTIVLTLLLASTMLPQAPASKSGAASKSGTAAAKPSLLSPASLHAKAPDVYKAQFTTTKGDFVIEVHRDWAPLGADRFYNLVKNGFYDDVAFFRVVPDFMVQFGMSGNPQIEAAWGHASVKDDPVKQGNARGRITFAMGGPNTRTTQVFINLADNARLDPKGFSAFGAVSQGMDVVDQFYSGYGEGAPDGNGPSQKTAESEGNAYLSRDFPKLDYIKKATIEK